MGKAVVSHLVKPLDKCLRLKRNLAVFANEVASRVGVSWKVKPNNQAGGGRVILLEGSYREHTGLQEELLQSARVSGNDEIDFLFCVPPADVGTVGGRKQSRLGQYFVQQGFNIWDGTDPSLRKDFPRLSTQYRIVQYASCRGLEGWTVVLESLDSHWELLRSMASPEFLVGWDDDVPSLIDPQHRARKLAWQQLMIALTRPMDTLVITLDDIASDCSQVLLGLAEKMPEIVLVREKG